MAQMLKDLVCKKCFAPIEYNQQIGAGEVVGKYYCASCRMVLSTNQVISKEEADFYSEEQADIIASKMSG